jgi:fermentation-respiration switch protein FrsA (DUF1100 family)
MQSDHINPPRRKSRKKRIWIASAIALCVLFLAALIAIPYAVMPMFLDQRFEQAQYASADYGIASERVTLKTDDALSIAAWRTRADEPRGTMILLSGMVNPSVTAFFGYANMLAEHGWDCLLIEMRARSESEGEEIGLGMTEWLDVKAGVDFLAHDDAAADLPIAVMGTSMGAGVAIIAAGEIPEIDAVISISAFSSWANLFAESMAMSGIPKAIGVLDKPFVNLYLGLRYGFDAVSYSPLNGIAKLGDRPILLMHSTQDSQVPFSEFERLQSRASAHQIDATTFIREGDEHFVCYDEYVDDPSLDAPFSSAVLDFLDISFP